MSSANISSLPGASSPLQVTGLASGLDTNSIINSLMAIERQPVTNLTNHQNKLTALNTQLTSIQSALRTMALNAQALGDPALFATSQAVTSSNSGAVTATSSTGAGVGGYQVAVTQLANSSQRTFTFASPASADTISIDGHQTAMAAGASVQDLASAINSDQNATVWAAATDSSTIVLSTRQTGDQGPGFIQVSDPGAALTEQSAKARQGIDAQYSIDGVAATSHSNTVTSAIAGVTLSFTGVTTTTGPATVNVQPPAPNAQAISSAVTTFVNSYNSIIDQVSGQVSQTTSSSNPNQGLLFGDLDLSSLLGNMRTAMYAPGAALPAGMASLADIGISTGAASGTSSFSHSSVQGKLTIDTNALTAAIQSNPSGVAKVLQGWSSNFSQIVNNEAGPGGSIDTRIQGDQTQISNFGDQIATLNEMLTNRQKALQAQFAQLEATLSTYQSEGNWLSGQITAIQANNHA